MKIIYTETGEAELFKYQLHIKNQIEELVFKQKTIFGDETLEITGADIRNAIKIQSSPQHRGMYKLELASIIYIILGIVLTTVAFLYDYLQYIIQNNEKQFSLLILGAMTFTLGVSTYVYARSRKIDFNKRLRKPDLEVDKTELSED